MGKLYDMIGHAKTDNEVWRSYKTEKLLVLMSCNPELCKKRQFLIRLGVNNIFQLHLSSSAIEKKLVAIGQKVSVTMQLEGHSKDACAGVGERPQHWNKYLLQHMSS